MRGATTHPKGRVAMSVLGPSRQAAFFGPTVANGALRTWLDQQLAPTLFAVDTVTTVNRHF